MLASLTGRTWSSSIVVGHDDCADRWGNAGSLAFSTPALLGNVERECVRLLSEAVAAHEMTVGMYASLHHVAPTPRGASVRIELTVTAVRGRRIEIEFEAFDGVEKIGYGSHGRAVVRKDGFHARIEEKLGVLVAEQRDA